MSRLDRLFGYISTHKNMSVVVTAQQEYDIPVKLRRKCSHMLLYTNSEPAFLSWINRKMKFEKNTIKKLLNKHCEKNYDFLVFAFNEKPMIRKNLFESVEIEFNDKK